MKLSTCVVAVAVAALAASSALAKEGVEATLLTTVPKHAAPGSTIRIEWRLADLSGRPFGAGGIFVRLIGPGGVSTTAFADDVSRGRFAATATVPVGGLRGIRIGLRAMSCGATCKESPLFFRIVNDPFTDVWTPLRRPIRLPTLLHGARCPVSRPAAGVDFARFGVGRGYGPGPAYPIGLDDGGVIHLVWGKVDVDARIWGVQKLLWFVHPRYRGPVLVRGSKTDGRLRVRFERGRIPPAELRLPPGTRDRPSYVRIKKPGCYAFQIDGLTFSRTIVFRAET
ncbi:MAG TPA: hypothetical protein VGJ77_19835 [Gaiellaceae bacterium]